MAMTWTDDQRRVIESQNRNLLVAAAAGSGKTAVLVERIIRMVTDKDDPVGLDRLLVMTFTNAAAAEMRERIGAAVERELLLDPDNDHLQQQAALLPQAPITTIDSFCLKLIRENFDRLSIDPLFRIGDEGELLLLQGEVLEQLIEDEYGEGGEEFHHFVESYALGKSDDKVKDYIMQVYRFAQSNPWPSDWIRKCRQELSDLKEESLKDSPWMEFLLHDVHLQAGEWAEQLRKAEAVCGEENGPAPYLPMVAASRMRMEALMEVKDYGELAKWARVPAFDRLAAVRGKDVDPEKKEFVSDTRGRIKKAVEKMTELYVLGDEAAVLEDLIGSRRALLTLLSLAEKFAGRYQEAKRERNMVDFNDLEHFALEVLTEEAEGGRRPGPVADQLAEHFREILVDEYQDSNMVQETLIQCVCGERFGRPNVLMVGDVKQSIYKFRLACPELFLKKYKTYTAEESSHQKIELHQNFRSRETVLDSINDVFYGIMTEKLGDVEYTEEAALHPGAKFAGREDEDVQDNGTELLLLNTGTDALRALDEDAADFTSRELEARLIGERIRALTDPEEGLKVWDKEREEYRIARYSDIVILLRSVAGWAEVFIQELGHMGIPAFAESKTGYFTTIEVETVLNLLAVLDNPMQDIPLTAVLRSPVGGLDDRELAVIAADYKKDPEKGEGGGMYAAVRRFLERGDAKEDAGTGSGAEDGAEPETSAQPPASGREESRAQDSAEPDPSGRGEIRRKLFRCLSLIDSLRAEVPFLPMHQLLYRIYDVTGYYDYVSAMPAGEVRQANLDMLVEKASSYEATSFRGLFHFIKYIEELKRYNSDFGEASAISEQDNTVRIVSIHKSKGLEYPVVILAGMAKSFNKLDVRGKILIHNDLGIAADYLDPATRQKAVTLKKNVLKRRMELESLGEELRVLYVAMTRAKEKLIMTASDRYLENRLARWQSIPGEGRQLPFTLLAAAGSYLDWVLMALTRPGCRIAVREIPLEELLGREMEHQAGKTITKELLLHMNTEQTFAPEYREQLEYILSYRYPHEADQSLYAKMSVSEIKRAEQNVDEEESRRLLEPEPAPVPLVPSFMEKKEQSLTAASRGTAYHRVMERLPFGRLKTDADIGSYIEEMAESGYLDPEIAKTIPARVIRRFLDSGVGRRMERAFLAGTLHREQQFVVGIPAREMGDWDSDELILIQGIVDAWFEEDGGIVLVDYKTDFVLKGQEELLKERYRAQFHYYSRALEQMFGRPVKEQILYSFQLGEIPVESAISSFN